MISPDKAGRTRQEADTTWRELGPGLAVVAVLLVGFWLASATGRPWLRLLDLRVADGDPRDVALAAVAWCWLLLVPITLAAWASRRLGRPGWALWLLVVAGVAPLVAFLPVEVLTGARNGYSLDGSGTEAALAAVEDALGYGAPTGMVSFISYVGFAGTFLASVFVASIAATKKKQERPGIEEVTSSWRGPVVSWVKVAVVWTVVWAAMAGLVVAFVDSFPGRGSWLGVDADQLVAGPDGVTGPWQVALEADVAEVVSCQEAAAAIDLDGAAPDLPGCRSALLVSATGLVEPRGGGEREPTGSVVGVVLQTTTPGQVEPLQASLDGAELTEGAGLPAPPGRTLVTSSSAAFAVLVTAEDPGEAPAGEGSAAVPLTRSLAYLVIGTAQELYVAPDPVPAGRG